MAKKKSLAQKTIEMSPEELSKLTFDELRKAYRAIRISYGRRKSSIERQGEFSHAQYKYETERKARKSKSFEKMSRNQLLLEVVQLQQFFEAKTSTVEGIRKVNYEQDVRLFGKTEKGAPRNRLTNDERRMYWDLYDEWMGGQYHRDNPQLASSEVQYALADIFSGKNGESKFGTKTELLDRLTDLAQQIHDRPILEGGPNVLSGNRHGIKG